MFTCYENIYGMEIHRSSWDIIAFYGDKKVTCERNSGYMHFTKIQNVGTSEICSNFQDFPNLFFADKII